MRVQVNKPQTIRLQIIIHNNMVDDKHYAYTDSHLWYTTNNHISVFHVHLKVQFKMAMSKLAKYVAKDRATDEATNQLKFVDLPNDKFNCLICLRVLQDPYLTACCGNHFCEACIEKVKEIKATPTSAHCVN